YPKISAVAGPCGLWPEDIGSSIKNKSYFENKPYYNFGCAYQRNMAAMVDNPSDLVQPRSETPADTPRRTAGFEKYRKGTPTTTTNVTTLQTEGRSNIIAGIEELATGCDSGTRVVGIGRVNDVKLYRELVRRGVSDYLIAPVSTLDVVRSVCNLFSAPEAKAVGRIIAIVGAKGGVGASTVAHNIAWAIARDLSLD